MIDEKKLIEEIGEYTISVYGCDINDIIAFQTNNESESAYIVQGICEAIYFIEEHPKVGEWIPADEPSRNNNYILLSFENFSLPMVGRYEDSEDGGAYYLGDCDGEDRCLANDLFVNAWMPLPKPYRPEEESE